jgi:arylsulfatase A-like enzyme
MTAAAGRQSIGRRAFVRRVAAAGIAAGMPAAFAACAAERTRSGGPNLVFIMADDLGYSDLGVFGRSDYRTPALDQLAADGVRLTQAYAAAPVCSPTRVALMTGRYPAATAAGLYEPLTTHPTGLGTRPPTLPRLLKDVGYETALIGKWHLGLRRAYHPLRHGFDEFYGHLGAAIDYASGLGTEHLEHDFFDGTRRVRVDGYVTDLLTARAVDFVSRPRAAPFFLSLQYNAPHWPWQAPGDPVLPDSLRWRLGGSPGTYARMVASMDEGVGRLLAAIRARGLENDTLVIFTSDNGGERFSDMGPYREGKMTLWEGGIRVPALARWPGVLPAAAVSTQVVTTMDWTATLLAAAGAAADTATPPDGIDVLPYLRGAPPVPRELYWRIHQRRQQQAVRSGDWKYLRTEDDEFLFDLAADSGESHNLRALEPATFSRLVSAYAAWEAAMLPPIPLDPRFA